MSAALSQTKRPGQDCSPAEPRFPEIPAKDIPMNTHEDSTGAPEGQTYTVDDIIGDGYLLNHLLDITASILSDMEYGSGQTRNVQLDRVNALVTVASDGLTRLLASVEANYGPLIDGRAHV